MFTWEKLKKNKQLSELTTLKIGGLARFFYPVKSIEELLALILFAKENSLPFVVLGKGSNTLFDERGYDGLVIRNEISFLEQKNHLFRVGAGFSFAHLGVKTAREGWSGLEFASGIPGSVGGAIYMNAGANTMETKDVLHSVDYLTEKEEVITLTREQLHFGYRASIFQTLKGSILAATFALKPSDEARPNQIKIVNYRKETQPYGAPSAGCIFTNPPNQSAGALIEQAGLKGKTIGGAQVSSIHANFIINTGNATFSDLLKLVHFIRQRVKETSNITLETEVQYIPYNATQPRKLIDS